MGLKSLDLVVDMIRVIVLALFLLMGSFLISGIVLFCHSQQTRISRLENHNRILAESVLTKKQVYTQMYRALTECESTLQFVYSRLGVEKSQLVVELGVGGGD